MNPREEGCMSEMKFTPGPWQRKHDYTKEGACTIVANVDGETHCDGSETYSYDFICTCEDEFGEYTERAEANARLIAAAPELYAALSDIMENPQFQTAIGGNPIRVEELMIRAASALAKARGEA